MKLLCYHHTPLYQALPSLCPFMMKYSTHCMAIFGSISYTTCTHYQSFMIFRKTQLLQHNLKLKWSQTELSQLSGISDQGWLASELYSIGHDFYNFETRTSNTFCYSMHLWTSPLSVVEQQIKTNPAFKFLILSVYFPLWWQFLIRSPREKLEEAKWGKN